METIIENPIELAFVMVWSLLLMVLFSFSIAMVFKAKKEHKKLSKQLVVGSQWVFKPDKEDVNNPYKDFKLEGHCEVVDMTDDYVKFKWIGLRDHGGSNSRRTFLRIYMPLSEWEELKAAKNATKR